MGTYGQTFLKSVSEAVEQGDVRYMFGVFWRGKTETEKLFKRLDVCEGGLFFQPFWTTVSQNMLNETQMAAVAARFGVVPENASCIAVYPAYLVVRGPSKEVSVPAIWAQPWWTGELFPYGSGIERSLRHLSDVPQLPQNKEVNLQDFLPLKQKPAPLWRWRKGVHQLILWVGSSRPSEKCATNNFASKASFHQRAFDLSPPRSRQKARRGR